jgi:GNAT superfamily N-acetyltransferase
MPVRIEPLDASRRADFLAVMSRGSEESGTCLCTAYHGCDYAKAGAGPACRDKLFSEGRSDGYLLYVDDRPAGWCQCGPWSSFAVLKNPPKQPDAWAITCMVIAPEMKGKGLGHAIFRAVLDAIRLRGAPYVYAFGHRLGQTYSSPLAELPESVCVKAGMNLVKDDPECPIYGMRL